MATVTSAPSGGCRDTRGAAPLLVSVPRGPKGGGAESGQQMAAGKGDWALPSSFFIPSRKFPAIRASEKSRP